MLLTGARGTGKSSLIKACLNEFAPHGLRLIEVDKTDLVDLPDIVDLVAERPERFIVFCDDLSFDEGEPGYKALKSMLDGSIAQASRQRADLRHQQPPPPAARVHEGQPELHAHRGRRGASGRGDRGEDLAVRALRAVDQLLSVHAGRVPGDRRAVAAQLRRDERRIAAARQEALVWALERGSRSGRVAYPVRARLRRGRRHARPPAPSDADSRSTSTSSRAAGRRRGRRADRCEGPLPADLAARPARSTPATGSSRAASSRPARRSSRRCVASCTRSSASRSAHASRGRSS